MSEDKLCREIVILGGSNMNRCVAELGPHIDSIRLIASGEALHPEDLPPGADIRWIVGLLAHYYLASRNVALGELGLLEIPLDSSGEDGR